MINLSVTNFTPNDEFNLDYISASVQEKETSNFQFE